MVRMIPLFAGVLLLIVSGLTGAAAATPTSAHPSNASSASVPGQLNWTQLSPASSPSPRAWVRMAYDPTDNYTVLYGGYNPQRAMSFDNDTWEFQGGNWHQLSPASHPSATTGLLLAYYPPLRGVLAFGGQGPFGSAYYNDTWLFQGGNWTELAPTTSPPARSDYAMAYDPATSQMLLFGGFSGNGSALSDTWAFNGTAWTQAHSLRTPEGREGGSMVYDRFARAVLLIGGTNLTTGSVQGTWAFSGGQWSSLGMHRSTPIQSYGLLTTLSNGTPILFGGKLPSNGGRPSNATFEFFAGGWHAVSTNQPTPVARNNGGFAFDARDGYILLFGGYGLAHGTHFGDTWSLG